MQVRGRDTIGRAIACGVAVLVGSGLTGCKSVTEKYIALEVWKYEKLFGHLPPGFVPPGAPQPGAAGPRICGQGGPCQTGCQAPAEGCDQCAGVEGGQVLPGGPPPAAGAPAGPGGSPGPIGPMSPTSHVRGSVSKPVIISDEMVIP
ncbi:MAG: hypothetical protein ACK5SI_03100 [Planctomycetia bacterium]|jgi:hypothetical protein